MRKCKRCEILESQLADAQSEIMDLRSDIFHDEAQIVRKIGEMEKEHHAEMLELIEAADRAAYDRER